MGSFPIYKNFGNKLEKIKQIAKSSCQKSENHYNEKQERTLRIILP